MNLVLLSGGSGQRLWPLSNDTRSKQFIKALDNKDGIKESMVQRVWRQLESVGLSGSSIIATSKSQVDMIANQLGDNVPVVIEPERRDTFPAIALAATYLYSINKVGLDQVITILPVDPFVEDHFFNVVKELETALQESNSDIALVGIKPTYPSSKYGYIIPDVNNINGKYIAVKSFKEKPSEENAVRLIKQHALWNGGIFAFKLGYIISLIRERGLPIQYEELVKNYSSLPKISFDYEVVEKAKNIIAIPYDGYWKDLGTWNTLTEEMSSKVIGKGILSDDSDNSHIINELEIPVTVLGLNNIVVAASPDGILVTDKAASPRVKEIIKGYDQRPMYEERRWGWYRVLDYIKYQNSKEVLTKRIFINKGKNLSYQIHYKRSEVWTIIYGEGEFAFNDVITYVKQGDVLQIPQESRHGIKAISDLEFIEVQTGSELVEEDINRICMSWEEIIEICK